MSSPPQAEALPRRPYPRIPGRAWLLALLLAAAAGVAGLVVSQGGGSHALREAHAGTPPHARTPAHVPTHTRVSTGGHARLAAEVRPGDPVGRWGGDEFLAVLCLPYQEAVTRSGQISKKVCGRYILPGHNGLKLEVSATVGLSPHRAGQTSKEVFAAADLLLYGSKEASR